MDFNLPNAVRIVMVADPLPRMASMYYFDRGYTRGEFNANGVYVRKNDQAYFTNPKIQQSREDIADYIRDCNIHFGRTQWYWLREGTPTRKIADVIEMLDNGAFLVGLTTHFDASLVLFRHFLGMHVRDIIYSAAKPEFVHPASADWHKNDQKLALDFITDHYDDVYYVASQKVFQRQIEVYGGVEKLTDETLKFQELLADLNGHCRHVPQSIENIDISDRVICMVAEYDARGLAVQFGE